LVYDINPKPPQLQSKSPQVTGPEYNVKNKSMKTAEQIWHDLKTGAQNLAKAEPLLITDTGCILQSTNVSEAMGRILELRLQWPTLQSLYMQHPLDPEILTRDLNSILTNDPAAKNVLTPFLFFKGFHALQAYRLAHQLWISGRHAMAEAIQARISVVCGVDIHPAAKIGAGVMMDHATGIVIGETATVGDDVLFWHGVTLGGKSTLAVDRHPKIGNRVILGAGCILLGNIKIGDDDKIGAGAIVVQDVLSGVTVLAPRSEIKAP
jgi:serine O-acetyltransferase